MDVGVNVVHVGYEKKECLNTVSEDKKNVVDEPEPD